MRIGGEVPGRRARSQPRKARVKSSVSRRSVSIVAAVEMSPAKRLVTAVVLGVERQPLEKLGADAEALLKLLQRPKP